MEPFCNVLLPGPVVVHLQGPGINHLAGFFNMMIVETCKYNREPINVLRIFQGKLSPFMTNIKRKAFFSCGRND